MDDGGDFITARGIGNFPAKPRRGYPARASVPGGYRWAKPTRGDAPLGADGHRVRVAWLLARMASGFQQRFFRRHPFP